MSEKKYSGAVESNAGDDFHFLWAANKALEILNYNNNLKVITVEGPSLEDSKVITDEDALLSIDVAEYYDGNCFNEATRIIFSQLKYSVRKGDKNWTLSDLCSTTNVRKDNSILRRLADTFKGFNSSFPDKINKLELKLVSNRNIQPGIFSLVTKAKQFIESDNIDSYRVLKTKFKDNNEQELLKKIYDNSNLSSHEFTLFLIALDFKECGANARDLQEVEIIERISAYDVDDIEFNYIKLIQLIRSKMLPQTEGDRLIDKKYLLSCFRITESDLFPLRPQFDNIINPIPRSVCDDIAKSIMNDDIQFICAHGTGGTGKTTVINNLFKYLSTNTKVVIYDCYGGGGYSDPASPRHVYKRAITQICNDISLKCKTPLLIANNKSENEWLESLSKRLNKASELISEIDDTAKIVLVIDAVDNCYRAAEEFNEENFADKLFKITIPNNVCIITTARTENLELVNLPDKFKFFELLGFDEQEERLYLQRLFKDITKEQSDEVRVLTNGNPRLQSYFFANINDRNIDVFLKFLKPGGKCLDDIFDIQLNHMLSDDKANFVSISNVLINLPRPIPVSLITETTKIKEEKLDSISSDYLFGVVIKDALIYFRDEDFESYILQQSNEDQKILTNVADYMFINQFTDEYCMRYLHVIFKRTNDIKRLIESILTDASDEFVTIDYKKNDILFKRIDTVFSMEDSKKWESRLSIMKMLYLVTYIKKSNDYVWNIIDNDLYLSMQFLGNSTIYKYLDISSQKLNVVTKKIVFFLCSEQNTEKASEFYDLSTALIKEYSEKKHTHSHDVDMPKIDDIVNRGIFLAIQSDAEDVVDDFLKFLHFPAKAFYRMILFLVQSGYEEKAKLILLSSKHIDMLSATVIALVDAKKEIPSNTWSLLKKFDSEKNFKYEIYESGLEYRIILAEKLLLNHDIENVKILLDIDTDLCGFYQFFSATRDTELDVKYKLLWYAMKCHLENKQYMFADFGKNVTEHYSNLSEKEILQKTIEFKRIIDYVVPSYFNRVKFIFADEVEKSNLLDQNVKLLKNVRHTFHGNHDSRDYYNLLIENVFKMKKSTLKNKGRLEEYSISLINDNTIYYSCYYQIIKDLLYDDYTSDVGINMAYHLSNKIEGRPQSTESMLDFYIKISRLLLSVNQKKSKEYFFKAIDFSNRADDEAYRRIKIIANAAKSYTENDDVKKAVYDYTRVIEDCYKRMEDRGHFPYEEVFEGLAYISPVGAVAASCRLDDRDLDDMFSFVEVVPYIISVLTETSAIPHELAVSLMNISITDTRLYSIFLRVLLKSVSSFELSRKTRIINIICDDIIKLGSGHIGRDDIRYLAEWSSENGLQEECNVFILNDLLETSDIFEKEISFSSNIDKGKVKWESVDKKNISFEKDEFINLYNDIAYNEKNSLIQFYLEECPFSKQKNVVNILIMQLFSRNGIRFEKDILELIIKYLDKWSRLNQDVEVWRLSEDNAGEIIRLYMDYSYDDHFNLKAKSIVMIFPNLKEFIVQKVLEDNSIVIREETWKINERIMNLVNMEDNSVCTEFLNWCVEVEGRKVHEKSSDQPYEDEMAFEDDIVGAYTIYILKLLGHKEKELRWFAIHSLYNQHRLNYYDLINRLVDYLNKEIPTAYKDKDYFFYDEIAEISFLIALKRISEEPNSLSSKADIIKEIAVQEQISNITIRKLAADIAVNLGVNDKGMETCCDVVSKVTVPYKYQSYDRTTDENLTFRFNMIDGYERRYEALGEMFNKSSIEVARDSEEYIRAFGITNELVTKWNNQYEKGTYRYGSRHYVSNDNLRLYAQRMSMFYVADQYRKQLSLVDDEDYSGKFKEWLSQYLPYYEKRWLADVRSIPLSIPQFYDTKKYCNENSEYKIGNVFFENINVLLECNEDKIVLYSRNYLERNFSIKRIEIMSGFVKKSDKERFLSIISELHFIDEYFKRDNKNTKTFIIPAYSVYDGFESDIEENDSYNGGINSYLIVPNIELSKYFNLESITPHQYSDLYSDLPIKSRYWSYYINDRIYNYIQKGFGLTINKKNLEHFLKENDYVFIYEVDVFFEDGYSEFLEKRCKKAREKHIYLCEDDKTIKIL